MRARINKDGSKSYSIELPRLNAERGEISPTYVFLGHNKAEAKKLEHDLREKERRSALGLDGGARTFLGTFAELCEKAHENFFKGRRGERLDVSRLNRYGGASITREAKPAQARQRRAKPATGNPGDEFVSKIGSRRARELTAADFNLFFRSLQDVVTCRGTVLTAKAINRVRETLAKVFEVAATFGLWPKGDNPARASVKLDELEAPWDIWRPEEIGPMLAQVPPYWLGCCVVALTSALRKGELFGLLKADVDIERRVFLIWRSHDHDMTKGGDGTREAVPIHESALPLVLEWLNSPGPYLFPDEHGERRKETTKIEKVCRAAMVKAGNVTHYEHVCRRKGCGHREQHQDAEQRRCPAPMPGDASRICDFKLWPAGKARKIKFHATRHTAATAMLRNGVPLASVQKILRHKDPNTTMRKYGHLLNEDLVNDMSRLTFPGIEASASPWLEATGLAGQASVEHRVPAEAKRDTAVEHPPLLRTVRAGGAESFRAHTGHGGWAVAGGISPDYESGMFLGVLSVEPTGIEPVTYALRTQAIQAVSVVTASQGCGTIGIVAPVLALPSPAFSPAFSSFRAYAGHGADSEPGARPDCTGGASAPRPPAMLLTVRFVAARLRVSTARVYALIESDELGHLRIGNNSIRVSEADLAGYLARAQGGPHKRRAEKTGRKRRAGGKP